MAKIDADYAVMITMAGPVKFYKTQCPHGVIGMSGKVAMVGSTDCKLCRNFAGQNQFLKEGTELVCENVKCLHE